MGYTPSVTVALLMAIVTMVCWGSWSVTRLKCGNWRFEAWYIDCVWSIVVGTFVIGLVLGGVSASGWNPQHYLHSLYRVPVSAIGWAVFAGIVDGAGNFLFVAAIRLAGLTFAFPIGVSIALFVGTSLAFFTNPSSTAHPLFLFAGLGVILLAIIVNGLAHATKHAHTAITNLRRGIFVAVIAGILIALYAFPFNFAFERGMSGEAAAFYLAVGILIVNLLLIPYFMKHSLVPGEKPARSLVEYQRAKPAWHLWAMLGGLIWSVGTVFNLVVANQPKFSVAIAYTLGQCAALVGSLWGIFVWKEFRGAPVKAHYYLGLTLVLFIGGIGLLTKAAG